MYLGHIFITGPRQTIFLHSPPLIWGKFPLQIKIQVLGFESEYSKLDARTKNSLILSQNVKYGTFVATVTKNLTYALWENNSGSNLLRESSAKCEGLLLDTVVTVGTVDTVGTVYTIETALHCLSSLIYRCFILQKTAFSHWSRAGLLLDHLLVGRLFVCHHEWPNTQENGCWLPTSDHVHSKTLFQTLQDQKRGMIGTASLLHCWH